LHSKREYLGIQGSSRPGLFGSKLKKETSNYFSHRKRKRGGPKGRGKREMKKRKRIEALREGWLARKSIHITSYYAALEKEEKSKLERKGVISGGDKEEKRSQGEKIEAVERKLIHLRFP